MQKHSHGLSRAALPRHMELEGPNWVARSDRPGMVRISPALAARHPLPDTGSPPTVPEQGLPGSTFWWTIFASMMEGFALYGAALHPAAAMPVEALLESARDRDPSLALGTSTERSADDDQDNVVKLDRAGPRNAPAGGGWTRLQALGESLVAWPVNWRREREIRRAVAALMEFDERTLRDIGINGRSEIERVVRYCRDC